MDILAINKVNYGSILEENAICDKIKAWDGLSIKLSDSQLVVGNMCFSLKQFESDVFSRTYISNFSDGEKFRVVCAGAYLFKGRDEFITIASVHHNGYAVHFDIKEQQKPVNQADSHSENDNFVESFKALFLMEYIAVSQVMGRYNGYDFLGVAVPIMDIVREKTNERNKQISVAKAMVQEFNDLLNPKFTKEQMNDMVYLLLRNDDMTRAIAEQHKNEFLLKSKK